MNRPPEGHAAELRKKIIRSLRAQGFRVQNGAILPPKDLSKERIRELHETAVEHRIERARDGLFRVEKDLLRHIASGDELDPSRMSPRLVEVLPESEEELLFRYASLHWSVPVSSGYGRRLRFLVLRLAAGMMYLWGTNQCKEWLPPNFETDLAMDNDAAARMFVFYASHQISLADYKRSGVVKQVEILATQDSCNACKRIAGKRYKLNEVPELPYEHCMHQMGCRCTLLPITK